MKRTIFARFEIDDNDHIENALYNSLKCDSLKDFQRMPDVTHLKDDEVFKKLLDMKLKANKKYKDYIAKDKLRPKE